MFIQLYCVLREQRKLQLAYCIEGNNSPRRRRTSRIPTEQTQEGAIPKEQQEEITNTPAPALWAWEETNQIPRKFANIRSAETPIENTGFDEQFPLEVRKLNKEFDIRDNYLVNTTASKNPIFRFAWLRTEHERNDQEIFQHPDFIVQIFERTLDPSQLVFQLERGEKTQKLHFQRFFQ